MRTAAGADASSKRNGGRGARAGAKSARAAAPKARRAPKQRRRTASAHQRPQLFVRRALGVFQPNFAVIVGGVEEELNGDALQLLGNDAPMSETATAALRSAPQRSAAAHAAAPIAASLPCRRAGVSGGPRRPRRAVRRAATGRDAKPCCAAPVSAPGARSASAARSGPARRHGHNACVSARARADDKTSGAAPWHALRCGDAPGCLR